MRPEQKTLGVGLLAAALLLGAGTQAGCGNADGEGRIDLSQLPVLSSSASIETLSGDSDFLWVRPSDGQVNCVRAPCPSLMLHTVNTGSTELAYAYDWRALQPTPEQVQALEADAKKALLCGRYADTTVGGESIKVFQVVRVNPRVGAQSEDSPDADRYYYVKSVSTEQPTMNLAALLLNQPDQRETWTGMDLTKLGLSAGESEALLGDLQRDGVHVSTRTMSPMPILTAAFRPLGQ